MKNTNDNKGFITKPLGIGMLACLCCLLWGSATPAIKIGYEWFGIGAGDVASRILFAGVRFVLAGILTVIFGSIIAGKTLIPQKSSWGMICRLGMVQTVFQYIFFYMGLAYTTGVKSAIINGSQTFIAILMACLIFRYEKLTLKKFMGCLIGFAGVIVINFDPSGLTGGFTLRGEGAILVAAIAYALSSALVKRYSQKESPVWWHYHDYLWLVNGRTTDRLVFEICCVTDLHGTDFFCGILCMGDFVKTQPGRKGGSLFLYQSYLQCTSFFCVFAGKLFLWLGADRSVGIGMRWYLSGKQGE